MTAFNNMTLKDWIQYGSAIAMILSGIILTFINYFQQGDVAEGVLWYMAQALTYAGAIFGVSVYFRTKLGDFETRAREEIIEAIEEVERRREKASDS